MNGTSAKETKLSIMLRAKILAAEETQRILELKTELLNLQSDRLHQRELHLKKLESHLENERRQLSKERDAAFLERMSAQRDRILRRMVLLTNCLFSVWWWSF